MVCNIAEITNVVLLFNYSDRGFFFTQKMQWPESISIGVAVGTNSREILPTDPYFAERLIKCSVVFAV